MKLLYWIIGILICLLLLILIIGLILPKERVVTRQSLFLTTPETLYNIVTNNHDWQYRSGLKDLIIIEQNGEHEIWEEISDNGAVIRFTTREKKPNSFYSFDMDSKMLSGYWTATFEPANNGETLFTATEHISVKNPFIKTLSYLFFDIGKQMENYQEDLKNKIDQLSENSE